MANFCGSSERNEVVLAVAQDSLAVVLEDRAKDPAVPVIIGKLRVLQFRVQLGVFRRKSRSPQRPRAAAASGLSGWSGRVRHRRIVLHFGIHEFAVGFLVPPGVAEIRIHKQIALMHVAVHALARRDRARELVHDRMAALVFGDRLVGREAKPVMTVFALPAGVRGRTIIGINDVAGRAAARAVIARMIVRAHEIEQRIVQPGFLQIQEDRIGAIKRAETAFG